MADKKIITSVRGISGSNQSVDICCNVTKAASASKWPLWQAKKIKLLVPMSPRLPVPQSLKHTGPTVIKLLMFCFNVAEAASPSKSQTYWPLWALTDKRNEITF